MLFFIPNRYQDYDLENELFFTCSMKKNHCIAISYVMILGSGTDEK